MCSRYITQIKLSVTDKMTPWLMAIFCLATAGCSNLTDQLTSETNYNSNNNNNQQVAILKQIRRINEDGSYTYGYEAGDGSFKVESRDVLGNIKGTFGFVDADGEIKRVSYSSSNGTGFKATTLSPLREHVLRINKTTEKPTTPAALSPSREHILRINRTSTTPIAIVKAETVPTLSTLSSLRDHIFRISNRTTIPIITERTPIIIASNTNRKPLDLVTRPSSRSSVVQAIPRSNRKTNASTDTDDTENSSTSTTPISTSTVTASSTDQPRTIFNHYLLKNRPRLMINGQQRPLMVIERENVGKEPSEEEEDSQINRPNVDSNRTNHRNYKNYRRIIFNKRAEVKSDEEAEKTENIKAKEEAKPSAQEKDEERDDDEKLKVRGNNLRRQLNEDTVNPNKEAISVKETINTDETINRRQVIKNPIIESANSETDHSDVYGGSLLADRPLFTMIPKTATTTTTSTTPRVVQRVSSTVKPKAYLNRESLGSNIKYDDSEVYEPEIRPNEPRMRNQQVPPRLSENPGSIQRPVLASRVPEDREYVRNRPIFGSDNAEFVRGEPILIPRIPEQRDYVTNGPILIPRVPENQEYVTNRPILIPRIPGNPDFERSRSRIPEGQDLRQILDPRIPEDPRFVQSRPILASRDQDYVTNAPILIRNRPILVPRIPDERFVDFREQNYARQNFFGQRPEQFIEEIPRRVVIPQEPQDYRSANVERVLLRPLPGQQEANIHYSTENPQDLSSTPVTLDSNLRKSVNEETTTTYPYKGPVILRPAVLPNSNRLRSKTTLKPGNYETTTEQAYRIIPESSPRPEPILNDNRNENYDTSSEYVQRSMIPLPLELPNPIAPPLSRRDFQLLLRRLLISQYGIQALMYPRNYYMENVLNDQQGYSTYQTTESVNYNNQELQPSNADGYGQRGFQRVGVNYEQRGYRNFKDNSRERVKYNEEEGSETSTEKINYDYDSRENKENSNYNYRKNYDQPQQSMDYQNYGESRQSTNYNDNQEYKMTETDQKKKLQNVRVNDYDQESEISYSSQNPRMRSKDNMGYNNKLSLRYGDRVAIRRPVYSENSSPNYSDRNYQDNYENYEDMYSKRVYRQKLYQNEAVDDDNEILPGPIREALLLRMLQLVINNDRMMPMPMTSTNHYENSYESYFKKRGPVRSVQILGEEEDASNENERKEDKEMKMKEKMQ